MAKYQIVIDTNVFIAALRSQRGASFKLLTLINSGKFDLYISIPLILEYEEVSKRLITEIGLESESIDAILDYICKVAHKTEIFYLWRPFLKDPKDDMILELAFSAGCGFIVTYNKNDFNDVEQFGIKALTAQEFLQEIGELS